MSSKKRAPPQKRKGKPKTDPDNDNTSSHESFDWSSVFENGRIKSQIQEEDANAGVFPKKTLQLISTCSSLLLRKLVQASVQQQQQQQQSALNRQEDNDEEKANNHNVLVLSAQDIQESVASMDHLGFLQDALEQATKDDDRKLARLKPSRKRKPPPVDTAADKKPPSKKMARMPGKSSEDMIDDDCMKHALELSKQKEPSSSRSTDKITLDEEDYD